MFCGLFSSAEYTPFGVFSGTYVSLVTFNCCGAGFCIALHVVLALNSQAISKQGLYFCCKVWAVLFFVEAVFKLFSDYFHWEQNETERTDGESAKAVTEQVFPSRYKSEPGSFVFRSSASCQHCCWDFSVAHGGKNNIDKKQCPELFLNIRQFSLKSTLIRIRA